MTDSWHDIIDPEYFEKLHQKVKKNELDKLSDLEKAINFARIELDKPMTLQPMALSYGQDWSGAPLCVLGEGDYSCITGRSKSRKSFFKSALMALYIGGNATNHFPYWTTQRKSEKFVIDIDTEQSRYHAQRSFLRVEQMTGGGRYPKYQAYALRRHTPSERFAMVEKIIETYKSDIGLISIDGYSELIEDTNDNVQSARLSDKLMEWTDKYQFHITGVLHTNPDGQKMRGHIGSNVGRYASSVMKVEAHDTEPRSVVHHILARDEPFNSFEFEIRQGLPCHIDSQIY